jgi:hypothetical protein
MPALDRSNPTAWADAFIRSIIEERVADVVAGYDPSDRSYVFLEGPRWSTLTGAAIATGWTAYLQSPIRIGGYDWVEGGLPGSWISMSRSGVWPRRCGCGAPTSSPSTLRGTGGSCTSTSRRQIPTPTGWAIG